MCEYCKASKEALDHANGHIASLVNQSRVGTDSPYEYSGPVIIGGVAGKYTVVSPFLYSSEWKVDTATAGASASEILVSSTAKETTSIPDLTGASGVNYSGLSGLDGFLINVPANSTVPVDSEWYDTRNSENTLFIIISNGANAAYVNIIFRCKRK